MVTNRYAEGIVAVVVTPYADDELLLAGATIATLVKYGATVHVRSVTGGPRIVLGATPDEPLGIRWRELANACARLGVASTGTLGYPDARLFDTGHLRRAWVSAVASLGANLVLTTAPWCGYSDQRTCGTVALNTQHAYGDMPAPDVVFLDQFRSTGTDSRLQGRILDATAGWAAKVAAYEQYEGTQGGHRAHNMEILGLARGSQRQPPVRYAEAFSATVGTDTGIWRLAQALES